MPSLNVSVIYSDKIIYNNILLDDSIKKIKEKLFVFFPDLIPNLIKIEVEDNEGNFITIKNSNSLLFEYFETLPEEPRIYISNLQNEISIDNLQNMLNNKGDFVEKSDFKKIFSDFKTDYIDLTEDDLSFIIKLNMLKSGMEGVTISDIQDYIKDTKSKRDNLVNIIEQEEKDAILQQFYKLSSDFTPEISKISYNDINLVIIGKNVTYGSKGTFIKLNEIFNILELNENIPFIALGKKMSSELKQPQIKIYNPLINSVTDKEIKSWVLNEKKKLNEATYKIIKGIMIKSKFKSTNNYLTINILPNGLIDVNLKLPEPESNLEQILDDITENVESVINYINLLKTVFLQSKRISSVKNSTIIIDSIDTIVETGIFINRNKFESLIKQEVISKNILELKKTESLEILSAYYKKFKTHENIEDIKGITINIKDNPYKEDSSIIKIYGANNQNQAFIIVWTILILHEMSELIKKNGLFDDFTTKRKIREKTNKKKLKEQGIHFDSRECQSIRQPKLNIDNKEPIITDSYTITFNNQNYICDTPDYPYPGLTKNNIVCCFKHNQTGNENYIKTVDPESLNILVEPSNFKVKITDKKKSFETFVIKIVSEYKNGFADSGIHRYYYLSNTNNKLTSQNDILPIYNKNLINVIEQEDNIWLDKVPLSQIIYPSASNKCIHKPDLNNRISIHTPCKEHKTHKYFGYTTKSIPCCFDKEREMYISRKKKETDITKQYVIQSSDKMLNYQQLGILPQDISSLLSNVLNIQESYYRMGIIQNNSSFLNAILLALNNNIKGNIINNHNELKQFISKYLTSNEIEFSKLNNGNISIKYSNVKNYISYINNTNTVLNWIELLDLLERISKKNILVIDITDKSRLLCRPINLNNKKFNRNFIILLKRKSYFEVMISVSSNKITQKTEIIKEYSYDDKLIKFLVDYYKDTCIQKNVYPENYAYIPIYPHQLIISTTSSNSDAYYIKYQVKNEFNKINMLITKRGTLIPILETGIIDNPNIKIVAFSSLIKRPDVLLSIKDYINTYKEFNYLMKSVPNFKPVRILGVVDSNNDKIGGLITNFNYIIPYRKEAQGDVLKKYQLRKFDYKYYLDIDTQLSNTEPIAALDSEFNEYKKNYNNINNELFNMKRMIGNKLNEDIDTKDTIENLIKNTKITKQDKITELLNIFQNKGINNDISLLKVIANELLNDNKENLILNNIVTTDVFNRNEAIIRDSESILLNIDDIRKWIKKHQELV